MVRVFFIVVSLLALSTSASAQEACESSNDCSGQLACIDQVCSPPSCAVDTNCGARERCEAGVCVSNPTSPVAKPDRESVDQSADVQCGTDRRCRIQRLKRVNRARRQIQSIREERIARQEIERVREKDDAKRVRSQTPFRFGLALSRVSILGAYGGWQFSDNFSVDARFQIQETSSFSSGADGDFDVGWWTAGMTYNFLVGKFSPYLNLGFTYGTGTYFDFSGFGQFGGDRDVIFHAGEVGAGFDLQFGFGMHTRIGAVYRPLVHTRVSFSPGVYDINGTANAEEMFADEVNIDLMVAIGWAF